MKKIASDFFVFHLVSCLIYTLHILPSKWLSFLGKNLGKVVYYTLKDYRNTALTNLALAFPEKSFQERKNIAKQSCAHLGITLLEVLAVSKLIHDIDRRIHITHGSYAPGFQTYEVASEQDILYLLDRLQNKQGMIFFSGHQANWELPFLFITKNYPGTAIAKFFKNKKLNKKILSLREIFKGTIIPPVNAISKLTKTLHKGEFVALVADQALLSSDYSYNLFGHQAWTSSTPALLAYKTGKPIVGASIFRDISSYKLSLTPPLYANKNLPMKESVKELMDQLMIFLEKGIKYSPEQWMWIHKRWKRPLSSHIKKKYQYSHILIIIEQKCNKNTLLKIIDFFKGAHITLTSINNKSIEGKYLENINNIIHASSKEEVSAFPNSFKAVFNFTTHKELDRYYKNTGSQDIYNYSKHLDKTDLLEQIIEEDLNTLKKK